MTMSRAIVRTNRPVPVPADGHVEHNLPAPLTSFVGREREVAELQQLLASSRLVTLTGPGGCGKTRLALAAAQGVLTYFPDGVWLVELAALQDPALVLSTVAAVLGVRQETGRPLLESVRAHCRNRRLLLVMDNCEHLVAAVADTALQLLQGAPQLSVLAASREALAVPGEVVWPVPPLALPPVAMAQPEELARVESIRLFLDRARAARSGFAFTPDLAPAVATICQRLEGCPLAIELAAARVAHLAVAEIAALLDSRFRLLTTGNRAAAPRHQSLRAAVDWSYDLLPEPERLLLTRLAVFAGGFSLKAAEAICAGAGVEPDQVLDLLSQLVDKSLIAADIRGHATRYRMLGMIREYAEEKLRLAGEAPWRTRHRDWFTELAEQALTEGGYALPSDWPDRLEKDLDNLRAALRWCKAQHDGEAGFRLCRALAPYWRKKFLDREGLSWVEEFLDQATERTAGRARALARAGEMAFALGKYDLAAAYHSENGSIWRELGNSGCLAGSLYVQGHLAGFMGNFARGIALLDESAELYRQLSAPAAEALAVLQQARIVYRQGDGQAAEVLYARSMEVLRATGDNRLVVDGLRQVASFARGGGDYALARSHAEECLARARELGDAGLTALAFFEVGASAYYQGELARAEEALRESLTRHRQCGNKYGAADALSISGRTLLAQGILDQAAAHLGKSLALRLEIGDQWGIADCLGALGGVAVAHGDAERGARLQGAADALWDALGSPAMMPAKRMEMETLKSNADALVGADAFDLAYAAGHRLDVEAAVALALTGGNGPAGRAVEPKRARPPTPSPLPSGLTTREAEIVRLVAEGLTDREVATRLFISPRTVDTHLRNIFGKVGVTSRAGLATWAARNGLTRLG